MSNEARKQSRVLRVRMTDVKARASAAMYVKATPLARVGDHTCHVYISVYCVPVPWTGEDGLGIGYTRLVQRNVMSTKHHHHAHCKHMAAATTTAPLSWTQHSTAALLVSCSTKTLARAPIDRNGRGMTRGGLLTGDRPAPGSEAVLPAINTVGHKAFTPHSYCTTSHTVTRSCRRRAPPLLCAAVATSATKSA